jgi:hypothetical protein
VASEEGDLVQVETGLRRGQRSLQQYTTSLFYGCLKALRMRQSSLFGEEEEGRRWGAVPEGFPAGFQLEGV